MSSKSAVVAVTVAGIAGLVAFAASSTPAGRAQEDDRPPEHLPRFTESGNLLRPDDWQSWVMVGTSMGLSYAEDGGFEPIMDGSAPGMFHNVYMQPWAYRHFRATGEFPEGTMFILAMFEAAQNADPARGGWFAGEGFLAEIHLKQEGLHESGWGFYGYGGDAESAAMIPGDAACYVCHAEQTAFDNVFVQFYPALRDRLAEAPGG